MASMTAPSTNYALLGRSKNLVEMNNNIKTILLEYVELFIDIVELNFVLI